MATNARHAPPDVSIRLNDGDNTMHRPGSIAAGAVTLKLPLTRHVVSALVQFTGKTTTHSKRRVKRSDNRHVTYHYSQEVLFFDPIQSLASNVQIDGSVSTSGQFSFKFPARAGGPLLNEPYPRKATSHGFYEFGPHPLPLACIYCKVGHEDYFAIVSYNLVASVQLDNGQTTPIKAYLHPERILVKDPNDALFEVPLRSLAFAQEAPPELYDAKLL